MKLSHKVFVLTFCLALLPLFFVALHTTEQTLRLLKEREVNSAENNARGAIKDFSNEINRLKNLTRILAATRAAKVLPQDEKNVNRQYLRDEITDLFRTVLKQNPSYDQVRLIGIKDNAREVVRVERFPQGLYVTPVDKLQPKGNRYYFDETIALAKGDTFVSHIDLNREHGEIEQPLRPVIRVATPVTLDDGQNVGIIIINVNFHELVGNKIRPETPGDFFVTNAYGDYLHHIDQNRTFAFEFGRRERIQDDFGLSHKWLNWVTTNSPIETIRFETESHFLILSKVDIGFGTATGIDRKWVYGFAIPREAIQDIAKRLDEHLYITLLFIAVFIAVTSAYITSSLMKPVETLTDSANRIAKGDPSVSITVAGSGEIRILSGALQGMLSTLREAAKTQELAALGRMAAMLAHDLRNSLSTVKMNVQILREEYDNDWDNVQWQIADDQIHIMENVLADMLAFANPEGLKTDWHDPQKIAETVVLIMEPKAQSNGVRLRLECANHIPRVKCDRTKILQSLQNLLDNAIHFSPQGAAVLLSLDINQDDLMIVVSDEGPGVCEEVRTTLFDPFITNRPTGTGLGLAIVRKIVEQHGGQVCVSDQNEKGARFVVSLPLGVEE